MAVDHAGLDPLIRGLLRPDAYDHAVQKFDVLETHISWVILTGEYAYKLKKPVDFSFVNFTTLEKRRFCCEEELRLNRRQAHDLYLAVKPVHGPRDHASFRGSSEPIDYAVQMRQFSQDDLLSNVLSRGCLMPELLDQLAVDVTAFQQSAPRATVADSFGSNSSIRSVMDRNLCELDKAVEHSQVIAQLREWSTQEFSRCEAEFRHRKTEGKIREGHGDMHLGNMILRNGRIEVFDCLEFNSELRWIDVISEAAFLVMDLADRGRPDLGWRFFNEWLSRTGDYPGLKVWAWYFCYRALVRAKVAVIRRQQGDVGETEAAKLNRELLGYLQLAQRVTQRPPPKLIITHGLSGSGKSFWAQRMASEHDLIWMRSDVERKRFFAQDSGRRIPHDLYSPETTSRTYRHLRDIARTVLQSGWSVIVDATFLQRQQRTAFLKLAHELGVDRCLLSFEADEATLRERVQHRQQAGRDPSDATLDILAAQCQSREPVLADEGWNVISIDTESSDAGLLLNAAWQKMQLL